MKHLILFITYILFTINVYSQTKFQKIFRQPIGSSSIQTYDMKQTWDNGYILTGLVSDSTSNQYHPFLMRLDCNEQILWKQDFGSTQTTNNIFPRVIITSDSQFVCVNNLGVYNNYTGFIAKVDDNGIIQWQEALNLKPGNDNINSIAQTTDGGFILTGGAGSTPDVALVKLDANGVAQWQKTFGNVGETDEGSKVIQTNDGGYAITGRYISMGTFTTLLLKTDNLGNLQWLKCYGDTNQLMRGMDMIQLPNNDYVIVGSTTLLKPSHLTFGDNFIMRLNNMGDTLWTKIFYGNTDSYENASSVFVDNNNNFIVGVATASYASTALVPNKHAIAKFSSSGTLISMYTYNDGYSHYPMVVKANDGGTILSGFTTKYTGPVGFNTLLMKADRSLHTTCNETDVTFNTFVQDKFFKITNPSPVISSTPTVVSNLTVTSTHFTYDSTICISPYDTFANFTASSFCSNSPTSFIPDSLGIVSYDWDFGVTTISTDVSNLQYPSYIYTTAGNYNVRLIVSNGCIADTIIKSITINASPTAFNLGRDTAICKDQPLTIGTTQTGLQYTWSTGANTPTIIVSTPNTYILTISSLNCGSKSDTIVVDTIACATNTIEYTQKKCNFFMPNAFSPNGDSRNDIFKATLPNIVDNIKFEQLTIYNRIGKQVFVSNDITKGWDGTYLSEQQSTDVFFYMIRYKCKGETLIMKGDVTLVR
jgi:gliding motility-associated-like protein